MNISLRFPNLSQEALEHIFNAERELREAGVSFDTGFMFRKEHEKVVGEYREWSLDQSLKGAVVVVE